MIIITLIFKYIPISKVTLTRRLVGYFFSKTHLKMNLNSIKISTMFLMFPLIFGCNREVNLSFEDWDKDNDSLISYQEFESIFTANFYDDWNQNYDSYLDDEDVYVSSFRAWDTDEDDILSQDEWIVALQNYFGNYVVSEYDYVDTDNDYNISYDEYYEVIDETGYYKDWDLDEDDFISEKELAEGIFTRWDTNNDSFIDKEEYDAFHSNYLDI